MHEERFYFVITGDLKSVADWNRDYFPLSFFSLGLNVNRLRETLAQETKLSVLCGPPKDHRIIALMQYSPRTDIIFLERLSTDHVQAASYIAPNA